MIGTNSSVESIGGVGDEIDEGKNWYMTRYVLRRKWKHFIYYFVAPIFIVTSVTIVGVFAPSQTDLTRIERVRSLRFLQGHNVFKEQFVTQE